MALVDFIKKNTLLALDAPKRNLLGDLCIGWNRPANAKDEQTTLEKAEIWLIQDVLKAQKSADRFYALGSNDLVVFVIFYTGRRRLKEVGRWIAAYKDAKTTQQRAKVAVELANSKWFSNNADLGGYLAKKCLYGEYHL